MLQVTRGPQGPPLPEHPTKEDVLRLALWRAAEMLIDAGEHPAAARFFVSNPNEAERQTTDPAELALYLERTAELEAQSFRCDSGNMHLESDGCDCMKHEPEETQPGRGGLWQE